MWLLLRLLTVTNGFLWLLEVSVALVEVLLVMERAKTVRGPQQPLVTVTSLKTKKADTPKDTGFFIINDLKAYAFTSFEFITFAWWLIDSWWIAIMITLTNSSDRPLIFPLATAASRISDQRED